MMELTIKKLIPLLTSPIWYERLVGEYYEVLIRIDGARSRIETLCKQHSEGDIALQNEIEMMQEQLYIMRQYEDVLDRRLAHHAIPHVDILSERLDASDVLTDLSEPPKASDL